MTTRLLFISLLLLSSLGVKAERLLINNAKGWIESVYAEWQPSPTADSYNVYYSGEGITDKKANTQLIRSYGDYYRVDIPGLKAGNYTLKIVPVTNGSENEATVTETLTVTAHDRSGFAFANGRIPGAYNADGTLKEKAVILYITQNSKNKISMEVSGANSNPCVGLQAILDGFKKGKDTRPLVIRIIGQITDLATMYNGDIVIENNENASSFITLEGIGNDAVLDGWGVRIKNAANIEVRNLGTMNCDSDEGDNISLQQDNEYIWVHHCDFFYGHAGSDSDQAKGDGALDCKKSTYVTFSYNHFWDSGKSNLLGLSEGTTDGLYITYHHNWYDHSDSRHPRVRYYSAHVYNNYYDGNAKYGVGSTLGSSVFVEKNYFRNCKNPMMISMQGTDTKMGTDEKNAPTFSKEDGGIIKAFDNIMVEKYTFAPYSESNKVHFDAYTVTNRDELVPTDVTSKKGGNKYNNFDTNVSVMYDYTPHSTDEVVEVVTKYAGRIDGGDFKWTFNNAVDDASYDVNPALKSALTSYKTQLVAVQGDESGNGGGDGNGDGNGDDDNNNGGPITNDITHNFTTEGKESKYFTILGNLSTSKGSVVYNNLTLTQCLKMESSTSITFTLAQPGVLTLVIDEASTKAIYIDDTAYNAANGIVTVNLAAGSHSIKKKDTANLFFIGINTQSTGIENNREVRVRLYPNPVAEQLFIDTEAQVECVEIFNMAGTHTHTSFGNQPVQVSQLPSGIYVVRITTASETVQQRIIKR